MERHTKFGLTGVILGAVLGGLVVGVPLVGRILTREHHYKEYEVFFEGRSGESEVRGVSYFDYTGWSFMEGNWWRVDVVQPYNRVTTIYRCRGHHSDPAPYQPKIAIVGSQIIIEDGEKKMTVEFASMDRKPDAAADAEAVPGR